MKITCRYSGLTFEIPGFKFVHTWGEHGIFSQSLSSLDNRIAEYARGELSDTETKLLFTALVKITDLVHLNPQGYWHHPFQPDTKTVNLYMQRLIDFIHSMYAVGIPERIFPKFAMRPENADGKNFHIILGLWEARVQDWREKYKSLNMQNKLAAKEARLDKLFRSPLGNQAIKYDILAKWVMDASEAPAHTREYWISLFKLKGVQIYQVPAVDLEELIEWMEDNLDSVYNNIYAAEAFKHIKGIHALVCRGIGPLAGITQEELDAASLDDIKGLAKQTSGYRLLDDESEGDSDNPAATTHSNSTTSLPQPPKPNQSDYPASPSGKLQYLLAQSKWVQANTRREQLALLESRMRHELTQAELDSAAIQEASEEASQVDPAQLNLYFSGGRRLVKRDSDNTTSTPTDQEEDK